MKWIIPYFLISSLAYAHNMETFSEFFQFLKNPDGSLRALDCPDTTGAPYCQDLAAAVCAKRRGTQRLRLHAMLMRGLADRSYLSRRTILKTAQDQALVRAPATWEEITTSFLSVRTALLNMVNNQPGITPDVKARMQAKITSTRLIDTETYFREQTAKKDQNAVMREYVSHCGDTGMNENSFKVDDDIVLCPGAILSGVDNGAIDNEEFLHSMTLRLAHGLARPIGKEQFPQLYLRMGNCYNELSGVSSYWEQKGNEISSDYWASRILSQRIVSSGSSQQGAVTALFQNIGHECGEEKGGAHQKVGDRINLVYGRNPVMREMLGCSPPTADRPVCGLMGKQH